MRRDLTRNRGGVALIGGPAGIGKSRLLAEFRKSIAGGSAPLIVRTECLEGGGSTYGPIRALLHDLAKMSDAEFDGLAESGADRAAFYRSLANVLFERSGKRAIIVCIEDVHWADASTLDFIASLATHLEGKRVAVLATYRDDELEADFSLAVSFARIERAPSTRNIVLRPLSREQTALLLDTLVGNERPPTAAVLQDILARVGGNPFFAEELLKSALDGAPTADLPLSIRGTVLARFGRLDEDTRAILTQAAILGERFDAHVLAKLLDIGLGTIAGAMRRARELNLIVEERGAAGRFRFRHALMHEAIAARTIEMEARLLHARVAEIIESLPDAAKRNDEIAYHWWKARDAERALITNEAAGDSAASLHAYGDAAAFYERALSVATEVNDRARLYGRAALAASSDGDHLWSMRLYEQLLAIRIESRDFEAANDTIRRIAGRLTYAGRDTEGVERLREFLLRYGADTSELDALVTEGWPILMTLGGGGARAWREKFQSTAGAALPEARQAWNLLFLELSAQAYVGDIAAFRDVVKRIGPFEQTGTPTERALVIVGIATTSALCVEGASGPTKFAEAHQLLQSLGLDSMRKYLATAEAVHHYLHGDLQAARTAALAALGDSYDYNQRMNVAIVGASIGLELDDPKLLELATDERILAALAGSELSQSTALAATGVARRMIADHRLAEAVPILEKAVFALETLYATQLLLPLASRYVTSRARAKIESLLEAICDDDRSGLATRAMVRATFAMRDRAPDARELAREAARRYAELEWPLFEAAALSLGREETQSGTIPVRRWTSARTSEELTSRERVIARLVAAGSTNNEIAKDLSVSVKTVESHLTRIFTRLGFRSRAQLAAYVSTGLVSKIGV